MNTVPNHIAIIMDGNGRWAKKNNLPRAAGHKRGAEVFQTIVRYCEKIGVKALTVYAFSTENWSRSKDEVEALMDLFYRYLKDAFNQKDETARVHFIGRKDRLPDNLLSMMDEIERSTANNQGLILNIAVDYGGQDEITHAAREIAKEVCDGKISIEDINEDLVEQHLFTHDSPKVDFILRPSGEKRLSNFLLWQAAYSEFIFMDVLWPDFTPELLDKAILEFSERNRRFGGR
ncbi:MAG: isoprenyl transferase [Oscillospiraceae bacterium]|nr:isoprenyl transferase [Oscillospiraceae bacterium]